MGQSRLNSLATISTEHELAHTIGFKDLIDNFAQEKARKKLFAKSVKSWT